MTTTETDYDLADDIERVLEGRPDAWMLPSEVARKLKRDVAHVRPVLQWMARNSFAVADTGSLNSRTRYCVRTAR